MHAVKTMIKILKLCRKLKVNYFNQAWMLCFAWDTLSSDSRWNESNDNSCNNVRMNFNWVLMQTNIVNKEVGYECVGKGGNDSLKQLGFGQCISHTNMIRLQESYKKRLL